MIVRELSDDQKLYFGGYLVTQMVYVRERSSDEVIRYLQWLVQALQRSIVDIPTTESVDRRHDLISYTEEMLLEVDEILDGFTFGRQSELLELIDKSRDVLFGDQDRIKILLAFICQSMPQRQHDLEFSAGDIDLPGIYRHYVLHDALVRFAVHQIRGAIRDIGGVITHISMQLKRGAEIIPIYEKYIDMCLAKLDYIKEDCLNADLSSYVEARSAMCFGIYSGTVYHTKSAELLAKRASSVLTSEALRVDREWMLRTLNTLETAWASPTAGRLTEVQREIWRDQMELIKNHANGGPIARENIITEFLGMITVCCNPESPRIGPLIDFIRSIIPLKRMDDILIRDNFVLQLNTTLHHEQ